MLHSSALRPSRRSVLALAGLGAGAGALAACGAGGEGSTAPVVVAGCYPMEYLLDRIGGEEIDIVQLAKPGADAHGIELSPKQVIEIQEAALVVQIPGLQTALDDAISSHGDENVLDVSTVVSMLSADEGHEHEHEHEGSEHDEAAGSGSSDEGGAEAGGDGHDHGIAGDDPHLWHDPARMADIADALAQRLGQIVPEAAETFTANAETVRTELEDLDAELAESFGAADGERTFVTSHTAFSYLADRYDLTQVGITGIDPETEPSPQRLLELEGVIAEAGVTTIFFETTASPKVAQTLADNVGVEAEELDNLATQLSEDADYPQVMRENSRKLVESWS
ncbi:metal ABC transporter substrate-binding protein [Brachybacterium sp. GCM10030267]|uniref:metal ABC transporter substrate-binding protein n=1 Tax=unclassified Brachybacterium TaxID=2623841 RepID=UPI003611ABEE